MATPTLVDRRIAHGEQLLEALDTAGVLITSAFWLYVSEWDEWRLVFAMPIVDESGPTEAYGRVQKILNAHLEISFGLDRVTVVGEEDRSVRALQNSFSTWPARFGSRFEDRFLRARDIENSYVYRLSPPPEAAATKAKPGRPNGAH